ncbi:GNAT family N-acetyltransferase [Paenibacillus sp.]|uniref:GNAT family N-acetyltransferase n=1 Tax=Paenibacillus sp. TaxID=58172 RepID=UPI002D54454D|nr:GNAT family N-acetyltransferase [Paenibacillus sp.]HZG55179.1 GNAT family N-acetyltransferase [Paenibacillus sp.]
MHVRSFQLSDYAEVTQLMENSLSEDCFHDTMEAFARQLSWDSSLVMVARAETLIVGVVIGTIDNNDGYYYRIAVDPFHRRKGVGKALIQALQERFVERKVNRILVPVDVHNEPVLPVFESLGFDPLRSFTKAFKKLSIVAGT